MDRTVKTVLFWTFVVVSAALLWQVMRSSGVPSAHSPEITYSAFISKAQAGEIARVSITGTQIEGEYRKGAGEFHLTGPSNPAAFLGILQDQGVEIRFRDANDASLPLQLLGTWAPLILLAALWFFLVRQTQIRRRKPPIGPGEGLDSSGGLG
jgi:cell division protease FtsH